MDILPGLTGIVLPQVEAATEVGAAGDALAALEKQRGIAAGSLQLIVLLASAQAVWDIRAVLAATPRLSQVGLNEGALAKSLGIKPDQAAKLVPAVTDFVGKAGGPEVGKLLSGALSG